VASEQKDLLTGSADEQFGLCYVRVPTWAPFRLQVYFNGRGWLARQLRNAGIDLERSTTLS